MKDHPRQSFRWQPHTGGITNVKPKDFQEAGAVEAPNAYAVWSALKGTDEPLDVGDVIESDGGTCAFTSTWALRRRVGCFRKSIPLVEGAPLGAELLDQAAESDKS